MIVIFVVDTSQSMGQHIDNDKQTMSKLDLGKMTIEGLVKVLDKRITEHNKQQQQQQQQQAETQQPQQQPQQDHFLLLSTGRQTTTNTINNITSTVGCGAGGRLLVGFNRNEILNSTNFHSDEKKGNHTAFERELKNLKLSQNDSDVDLNVALSTGLQLLSRYRLENRSIENFGCGRYTNILQPACLVLVTDGGDSLPNLQLQFGNMPLREFYKEPFRWDQRLFCVHMKNKATQLHSSLKKLCEVTGGGYISMKSSSALNPTVDFLLRKISPLKPKILPIPDPFKFVSLNVPSANNGVFLNGGPVCTFQSLEQTKVLHRAMLLHVPIQQQQPEHINFTHTPPIWCIPESFFSNKKLDTLPPRTAQPILSFSKNYSLLFDPIHVMKLLHHYTKLSSSLHRLYATQNRECPLKSIQRDVYICEWLSTNSIMEKSQEYLPISVKGAGNPKVSDNTLDNLLHIGILHTPPAATSREKSTLTLLPPDANILLPLLITSAEAELRSLKKNSSTSTFHLDDHWRNEFRSYMHRTPPYYLPTLRRFIKPLLLPSVQNMISESNANAQIELLCYSRACFNKLRTGEAMAKEANDRLEKQEEDIRKIGFDSLHHDIGYGQYDVRSTISSYLAALKNMPPPPPPSSSNAAKNDEVDIHKEEEEKQPNAVDVLGDLPAECLLAYYESRRRWIHGGPSLATKGLSVEGVMNDGEDRHFYKAHHSYDDECLLSIAGVGASMFNKTTVSKMGDYREHLLFSKIPVVGQRGSASASNGAPALSVDDDALPLAFFDQKTGMFVDSYRVKARMVINFGNPFKSDKRGNSIVPANFQHQRPPSVQNKAFLESGENASTSVSASQGEIPSAEGEGEAVFAGSVSPPRVLGESENQGEKEQADAIENTIKEEISDNEVNYKKRKNPDSSDDENDELANKKPNQQSDIAENNLCASSFSVGSNTTPKTDATTAKAQEQPKNLPKHIKPPPPPPTPPNKNHSFEGKRIPALLQSSNYKPSPLTARLQGSLQTKRSEKRQDSAAISRTPKPTPSTLTARIQIADKIQGAISSSSSDSAVKHPTPSPLTARLQVAEKLQNTKIPSTITTPPVENLKTAPSALTTRLKGTLKPLPPAATPPKELLKASTLTTRLKVADKIQANSDQNATLRSNPITLPSTAPPPPKTSAPAPPPAAPIAKSMITARLQLAQKSRDGNIILNASKIEPSNISHPRPAPPIVLPNRQAPIKLAPPKSIPSNQPQTPPLPPPPKPPSSSPPALSLSNSIITERLNSSSAVKLVSTSLPSNISVGPSILSERLRNAANQPPPPPPPAQVSQSMITKRLNLKEKLAPLPKKQDQQLRPQPPQYDLQNPSVKPNINLPPNWMCVWSKSQQRWYFFDKKSNKSVWQWPPK